MQNPRFEESSKTHLRTSNLPYCMHLVLDSVLCFFSFVFFQLNTLPDITRVPYCEGILRLFLTNDQFYVKLFAPILQGSFTYSITEVNNKGSSIW